MGYEQELNEGGEGESISMIVDGQLTAVTDEVGPGHQAHRA